MTIIQGILCIHQETKDVKNVHAKMQSVLPSEIVLIVACLQIHTSIITVSVIRLCSPLGLELMLKLRTLLTVLTFILKAEAHDYGNGRYISDAACEYKLQSHSDPHQNNRSEIARASSRLD